MEHLKMKNAYNRQRWRYRWHQHHNPARRTDEDFADRQDSIVIDIDPLWARVAAGIAAVFAIGYITHHVVQWLTP